MGALLGEKCFINQSDALDAYYSAQLPSVTAGTTTYVSEFVKVSGVWKVQRKSISSTGTVTAQTDANAPVISFPTCVEGQNFADGLTVGWGIAGAMIAAWAIAILRRSL